MNTTITNIPGVTVGHWTDLDGATGCTVLLCPEGAVGGVDVRGAAPGTRETDLLRPGTLVDRVHAVLLSGGSAFGLDAASGVMAFLESKGFGFPTPAGPVPIVPAAILYDLGMGRPGIRPGGPQGELACIASSGAPVAQGSVGAGTGATVGKALGKERALKGGLGSACLTTHEGWSVAAIMAVNAAGDVVNPETGQQLAGPRAEERGCLLRTESLLIGQTVPETAGLNTTIGIVATDAPLTVAQANRLATMAQDGVARATRPSHTMSDGDVIFALSLGTSHDSSVNLTSLGSASALAVSQAIVNAVEFATGLVGTPSASEWGIGEAGSAN